MTNTLTKPADAAGHWRLGGARRVARMGFGAMRLPARSLTGPAVDRDVALAVLRRTREHGVDHIDTAAFYTYGERSANELIRAALWPYPEELVIATKVGPTRGPDGAWLPEQGPAELPEAVHRNLRELGRDELDLVYLRVGSLAGPPAESVAERFGVLARLQDQGLIRHLGLSNVSAVHLAEARRIAPVAAVQNYFNVAKPDDVTLLETCERDGIAFVPFFPLGGGHQSITSDRMTRVAARHGATPAQVALAWLLDLSPATLAIPGTSSPSHLDENIAAAALRLTPADRAELAGEG